MPRARTSVATITSTRPFLNAFSERWRWACERSPWIASALKPSRYRRSARLSARNLVRVKMITRSAPFSSRTAFSRSGFCIWETGMTYWSTVSAAVPLWAISTNCGSLTSPPMVFMTDSSMVAENSSVWRSWGRRSRIWLTSGQKPMSSMRSASSMTRVLMESSFSAPRS